MEFLAAQFASLYSTGVMVLGVLFVFTLVVFIHELGHFLVARWCGVNVQTFSIGFGPEIFGWSDRHGTRWRFSWIPLGGYVKFIDDENAASVPSREALENLSEEERAGMFQTKTVWQRMAVVAAGPLANFLLTIVIFTMMFWLIGQPSLSPRVDQIAPDSAAQEAGFQAGDLIVEIDGYGIDTFGDLQRIVATSPGRELSVVVERDGRQITLRATPRRVETKDRFGNAISIGQFGISRSTKPEDRKFTQYPPHQAFALAIDKTYFFISHTLGYVGRMITGRESADQVGGPIKIAQIAGQAASVSTIMLFEVAALISISLGLINLFPIPVLDGGHLAFYAYEAIRGQPLNERAQEIAFRIGFALILMLMVAVVWKDILDLTKG